MAVPRRIRSSARARQIRRRRNITHFSLALIAALFVSSWSYRTASDQTLMEPAAVEAAGLATPAPLAATPTGAPIAVTASTAGPAGEGSATPESRATLALPAPTSTLVPEIVLPSLTPTLPPADVQGGSVPPALETPAQGNRQPPILYYTQSGDTLDAVAVRFGVLPGEIHSNVQVPAKAFISPGTLLIIPHVLGQATSNHALLPDSELVYSPTAVDFDIRSFVQKAGGFLSTDGGRQYMSDTGWTSGADIVQRVATENSINPRLLLALLELRAHWVTGQPSNLAEQYYPINANLDALHKGIYYQLTWAVTQLQVGYYSWREGLLTSITYPDGATRRLAPDLNAGTVALQYLFSKIENEPQWNADLYGANGFEKVYNNLFGSPWLRDQSIGSLFPPNLTQPTLTLPFVVGQLWSFTGGPHSAWIPDDNGGWAALDFAPATDKSGCGVSDVWAVAPAAGLVVRSGNGVVMIDLDGDGHEETGWDFMFLHIATEGRVPLGKWVNAGDLIGHPSCEGGEATGTHMHIARKYNGEWIAADGPLPFTMSGYVAHSLGKPYEGYLTLGSQKVVACPCGSYETRITRTSSAP